MLKLTFLSADQPLSKSFRLLPDGSLEKGSYPHVRDFTSHTVEVANLQEMAQAMHEHAALGHCLLKGNVKRPLMAESRAGSTDPNEKTSWVCLDIDRLPLTTSLPDFLNAVGCSDVDYIVQYSASYGIETNRGLTAHVMMLLDQPCTPAQLKLWLTWLNLSTPVLADGLTLTKTNTALSWPLDITTCQNDKLIYIAPPELQGVEDPFRDGSRISIHRGTNLSTVTLPIGLPTPSALRSSQEAKLNALRSDIGLPSRKYQLNGDGILKNCDEAILTGIRRERGFVYFNLNGGDSWGYYHPEGSPEIIYNFKGEPNYKTSELLPEYFASTRRKPAEDVASDEPRVLTFRDFQTGLYYNGVWDPRDRKLAMAQAKSETQIQHFRLERGLPELDFIPTWDVIFDPHSDVRVDFDRKRVNLWEPSPYLAQSTPPASLEFPTIRELIAHCVARNTRYQEFWLNWFACICQYRMPTLTAQVLHGIQGTGKGLLINHVITPLLGRRFVAIKRMEELEDPFNDWLMNALLVVVDEAQISESRKSKMIMANIKNQITEPTITVRQMRTAARTVRNYSNWIFLSNMPDPVVIDSTDRRFNVGEFRNEKLMWSDEKVARLGEELMAFGWYCMHREADMSLARSIFQSEERDRIIATSKTSAEAVAEALQKGMLEAFWEDLPSGDLDLLPVGHAIQAAAYKKMITAAIVNGKDRFSRDELQVMFEYLCGDIPRTPKKFTQFLRHRNLHLRVMRVDGVPTRGYEVTWDVDKGWLDARRTELLEASPKLRVITNEAKNQDRQDGQGDGTAGV